MQLISWFAYSWIWWCQVDLEHSSVVILWSQLECPLNMEAYSPIIVKKISPKSIFFPVRESGFWNPKSRRMFKWNPESWALQSGIQLKESGIQVTLVKTENQESWINTVESKTVLDFLTRVSSLKHRWAVSCSKLQVKDIWLLLVFKKFMIY